MNEERPRRWQFVVDVVIDEDEMQYEDEIDRRKLLVLALAELPNKYRGVKRDASTAFFEAEVK